MACNQSLLGIVVEPMNLTFGKKNKTCVTPVFPVVESSAFKFSTPEVKYYAWMNDGAGFDPALVGYTAIEVDTSAATNEAEVVTAIKGAVEAAANEVLVTISDDTLSASFENLAIGPVLEASIDVDTTFEIHTDTVGFGGALGYSEDIDLAIEASTLDITASQTGETLLDKFITGVSCEMSTTLLDTSAEAWSNIVGNGVGGNYTPSAGTEVTGYGAASVGKSFYEIAGTLVMHPVSRDASDHSRDVTIPLCAALPSSITYSGTDKSGMEITFSALLDGSLNSLVNLFHFGEGSTTQDLRK